MKAGLPAQLDVRIRRGGPTDVDFVRTLARDVFTVFGDYERILPGWLLHDGVLTHIAEARGNPVGYTMLGFYPIEPVGEDQFVADLLAIAVTTDAQGQSVGKRLLEHAIQQAQATKRRLPLVEMRLSVADTNLMARRLFHRFGFLPIAGDHGNYDGGQRALHMARRL